MAKPTQSTQLRRIAPFYIFYFLYFEPIMALLGTYLSIFDPVRYLQGTIPTTAQALHPQAVTPIVHLLIINLGSSYALFALSEGLVLRVTREKKVWFAIFAAMILCDLGHIFAIWRIDPGRMTDFGDWVLDEWINYSTLLGGGLLRVLFLLGIGWN